MISKQRSKRDIPETSTPNREEITDKEKCKFCNPDSQCLEHETERSLVLVDGKEYILAKTPYYYMPGHCILFPKHGPHSLSEASQNDWRRLLTAGVEAASSTPQCRFGFNAGSYLSCGGSQRHQHLQLIPVKSMAPSEEAIHQQLQEGASYHSLLKTFKRKGLVIENTGDSFLAACWAPRFDLELIAVFSQPKRFYEMGNKDINALSEWIYKTSCRFVVPCGGGLNGYGLEVKNMPFMVRIIPRLPSCVQAFMETGAGYMVINYLPESIPGIWNDG